MYNEKATERITFRWLFALLIQIETLLEAINTSAGVYQLLLTREEGVALGANVNDDILLGGAGLNDIAAGTADRGLLVLGMMPCFMLFHLFPRICLHISNSRKIILPQVSIKCKHYFS